MQISFDDTFAFALHIDPPDYKVMSLVAYKKEVKPETYNNLNGNIGQTTMEGVANRVFGAAALYQGDKARLTAQTTPSRPDPWGGMSQRPGTDLSQFLRADPGQISYDHYDRD